MKKDEAMRARRIIQGLLILDEKKIDLETIEQNKLLTEIENIGTAHSMILSH